MCNKILRGACLFVAMIPGICGFSQTAEQKAYLTKVSAVVNNTALQYAYTVNLTELKSGRQIDNISGRLYKYQNNYLDSNSVGISLVSGNYFFKSDRKRKQAYVYDLTLVEKALGIKKEDLNNSLMPLPDSLIMKMGTLQVDKSSANIISLRYVLKSPLNGIKEIQFQLNKKDESLNSIRLEVLEEDKWGETTGYKRTYLLSGFSNAVVPARFNTAAFFRTEGKQAKLQGIYKSYKLSSVI